VPTAFWWGNPRDKRPLGKRSLRWEYNITIVFSMLVEGKVMNLSDLG